jgi:anthranilate phosphoribosyltransferase
MGVADETLMPVVAEALNLLGVRRAMVVHSAGLDEISTMGPTKITELNAGKVTKRTLKPADLGFKLTTLDSLAGCDAKTNADFVKNILNGKDKGPRKDIVVLNAAAAIIVAGLSDDFAAALNIAGKSIETGAAMNRLEKLIKISSA